MTTEHQSAEINSDPAAVFACAHSLWSACHELAAQQKDLNISECFNGVDEFMREAMRVGNQFELWSCEHINFDETNDVWPYLLQDKFGEACLAIVPLTSVAQFDERDCLRVALNLRLPVILDDMLPVPFDVTALTPVEGTEFPQFRIQTMRDSLEYGDAVPFVASDEPFDEEFGKPYFGLYGVGADGKLEHIADRKTYGEIRQLAAKLAPGISLPITPTAAGRAR